MRFRMIYLLAALLPPLGLILNGQPFSAILNLVLIVFCVIFGLIFHILLLSSIMLHKLSPSFPIISRVSIANSAVGRKRIFPRLAHQQKQA